MHTASEPDRRDHAGPALPEHLRARRQLLWCLIPVCLIATVLIWLLWVLPVAASIQRSTPQSLGSTSQVTASAGERVGVWASGAAASFGLLRCEATDADGAVLDVRRGRSLGWDDTLWWMTPRPGFEQVFQVESSRAGVIAVTCVSAIDTYDAEFLVAGDTFMNGSIGLGRTGSVGFDIGSVLAITAVGFPLFAIVLIPVLVFGPLGLRSHRRRRAGS
ncbi:hypothetical protein [Microbacterium sp. SORGH_AS_0888]|uniref:hypothetical protein n=1 Tax=Microbacterium sp. SORGH_AS_0888 TaxID=3041791 RepID=UPI002787F461|nr:hypothetical protein [Microbacterium sp. SORGH_AS_0888]MDQ1128556.1 hypothetical protein [Microbacterium sp. SORGH_AS_0888]